MGREAFETKRTARIAAIELQLIKGATPELWLRLARVRLQQGRGAEALDAVERSVWCEDAASLEGALYGLGWPWEATGAEADAYSVVLADASAAEGLGGDVRQRTRWLLARFAAAHGAGGVWIESLRGELTGGLGELNPPECVAARLDGEALAAWLAADAEAIRAQVSSESF